MAMLTIQGLLSWDENLFSDFKLPVSPHTLDPDLYEESENMSIDILLPLIILECGELTIYPTEPKQFKLMLNAWNKAFLPSWQRIYNTYYFKYNPIWNRDGTITHIETESRDLSNNENTTESSEVSSKNEVTETRDNDINRLKKVAAFNSETMVNSEMEDISENDNNTMNSNQNGNGSIDRKVNATNTGTITTNYTDKNSGNIGVTTTQHMLNEERELYLDSIYDLIVKQFKDRFCILVY